MAPFPIFTMVFLLVAAVIGTAAIAFWIWMIVDVVAKEPDVADDKRLIWILVVVLAGPIGAAVYFFFRRPERIRQFGQ